MSRTELLQRAIHSAKCRIYRINYDLNCDISLTHQKKAENQKELMDITVEALEKQIPKKPKKVGEEYINGRWETEYECSSCGNPYADDSFCSCCGQALDWSDTE